MLHAPLSHGENSPKHVVCGETRALLPGSWPLGGGGQEGGTGGQPGQPPTQPPGQQQGCPAGGSSQHGRHCSATAAQQRSGTQKSRGRAESTHPLPSMLLSPADARAVGLDPGRRRMGMGRTVPSRLAFRVTISAACGVRTQLVALAEPTASAAPAASVAAAAACRPPVHACRTSCRNTNCNHIRQLPFVIGPRGQ